MYRNIQASLLRYCAEKSTQLNTLNGYDFQAQNFDAHNDESLLPNTSLLGIQGLTLESDGDEQISTFMVQVTVSTSNDTNNMLLSEVVDLVYQDFEPTQTLSIFDAQTGTKIGSAKVYGITRVGAVQHGESSRVYQGVLFQAALL